MSSVSNASGSASNHNFLSWAHYSSSAAAVGSSSRGAGPSSAGAIGKERVNREVLKGLRDAVWSDDEEEPECPLCMEELDPSDVNFKPCVCGYQVCPVARSFSLSLIIILL